MLASIAELTHARPHMRSSARFSPAEMRAYHEGYYTGVIMALRVADLAVGRFRTTTATLRAARRQKRSA